MTPRGSGALKSAQPLARWFGSAGLGANPNERAHARPRAHWTRRRARQAAYDRSVDVTGWASLELRHLLALRAIAESGSFHKAAARLG
jgi:hypothetical protein